MGSLQSGMTRAAGRAWLILVLACAVCPALAQDTAQDEAEDPTRADLSEARDHVLGGEFAEADSVLAELQQQHPDDPALLLMRGEVLLALGRPEQALPHLRRTLELDAERPRAHFQLGTALAATGDRPAALQAFARELELTSDPAIQVLARLNRSLLFHQDKQLREAAGELEAVLVLQPERSEAYGDLASLYLEDGRTEEAAQALESGAGVGFRSAHHYYSLGSRCFKNKAYEPAAVAFTRALEVDPTLAEAERSLAAVLDQLGRQGEADEHLKRYLQLKPMDPEAAKIRERVRASTKR